MFKGFGERLTHCRKAIGGMTNTSHCANADGDAWLYAYERLIKQPQQRKVMLCLSDGYPAYNSDYNDQYQRTSDVVAYMSKQVDVIGVGIQSKSVKNFFQVCRCERTSRTAKGSHGQARQGSAWTELQG